MYILACCLIISTLIISSIADVVVYNSLDFNFSAPETAEPRAVSQLPWQFAYHLEDHFFMYITLKNKSLSATSFTVTYRIDHGTLDVEKFFATTIGEYYYVSGYLNSRGIEIKLNLYSYEALCSSLLIAEGTADSTVNEELQYYQICTHDCVLEVDVSNECANYQICTHDCVLEVDVSNECSNYQICTHDCVLEVDVSNECSNVISTGSNTLTIIVSTIGVLLVLIVIIAVWIRCGVKRKQTSTPSDPLYLNMVSRREIDQEIAEIDQHQYEEIGDQQKEGTENYYEEINLK